MDLKYVNDHPGEAGKRHKVRSETDGQRVQEKRPSCGSRKQKASLVRPPPAPRFLAVGEGKRYTGEDLVGSCIVIGRTGCNGEELAPFD